MRDQRTQLIEDIAWVTRKPYDCCVTSANSFNANTNKSIFFQYYHYAFLHFAYTNSDFTLIIFKHMDLNKSLFNFTLLKLQKDTICYPFS